MFPIPAARKAIAVAAVASEAIPPFLRPSLLPRPRATTTSPLNHHSTCIRLLRSTSHQPKRWNSTTTNNPSTVSQRPGADHVHFPGAVDSKFTSRLTFQRPSMGPSQAIPTYRIMDSDGLIVDEERSPDKYVSDDEAVKMYLDMMTVSIMDVIMFDAQRQGRLSFYIVSNHLKFLVFYLYLGDPGMSGNWLWDSRYRLVKKESLSVLPRHYTHPMSSSRSIEKRASFNIEVSPSLNS